MIADGPARQTTETPDLDPEVQSAVAGIREIMEREIDFLQRQIKARGLGMNANDLAGLEVAVRPVLLDAVEVAAGYK